jgi:hypothetical protein
MNCFPEISMDKTELAMIQLKLLEEKYGGKPADEGDGKHLNNAVTVGREKTTRKSSGIFANYGIGIVEDCRYKMKIVDNWVEALRNSSKDMHEMIIADGIQLHNLLKNDITNTKAENKIPVQMAISELNLFLGNYARRK